jgi:hypothetical protein
MNQYSLTHLSDATLLRDLKAMLSREREATAALLARIAEVDARRLYAPAGYSSMFVYCVDELHLSEDAAAKRIHAARAARRFPILFEAVADGRLHLSGLCLIAPHLAPDTVDELIDAASHRRKSEIEELLARSFTSASPRVDGGSIIRVIRPAPTGAALHAPGHVEMPVTFLEDAPGHVHTKSEGTGAAEEHAPGHVDAPVPAERFLVQVTIERTTHDKLRHAQALLSHAVPARDVAQLLDRALDALIEKIEKRKLGVASRSRGAKPTSSRPRDPGGTLRRARNRTIPARVRRVVWERDRGRCTFVSTGGHRCGERRFLEFDHIEPVARGGKPTVEGLRLRCRAHNQYEAERALGGEFMSRKRREAQIAASDARARAAAKAARESEEKAAQAMVEEQTRDVMAGLRGLGCRAGEARRAAELSAALESGTFEDRMRAALSFVSRRSLGRRHGSHGAQPDPGGRPRTQATAL